LQAPDYKKIYYNASKTAVNKKLLFSGLYQGVGSIILITLPSCNLYSYVSLFLANQTLAGAFFTSYETVKGVLSKANHAGDSSPVVPQAVIHSVASATAELVSCVILTPAEVLKQNAQMMRKPTKSDSSSLASKSVSLQTLKQFKHPSQLFTGYTALAARNLPFTAMQFPMFEHFKLAGLEYRKKQGKFTGSIAETGIVTGISAGTAGSIAAWITTPIDLVKTRIMLAAAGSKSEAEAADLAAKAKAEGKSLDQLAEKRGTTKKGAMQVAREVMKENGVKGLFRGAALRSGWTAVGSGLYLGAYESGRLYLGQRRDREDDK